MKVGHTLHVLYLTVFSVPFILLAKDLPCSKVLLPFLFKDLFIIYLFIYF